jgi:ribonucleoside-diphosphate reductase subunit M1
MYYLRTMAASAPIQFTVDQAALQQVDTAVANKPVKKRPARPVPAPMMEEKGNGTVTPSSEEESDDQHVGKLAVVGNPSPKASPKKANGVVKKKREDMDEIEKSIYDEAVIACSIEV